MTQTINPFKPIATQTYSNGATVTITPPTASSGLPVIISVLSGPATISGNTVILTNVGTVVLAADQPGDEQYLPATRVTQSFYSAILFTTTAINCLNENNPDQVCGNWSASYNIINGQITNAYGTLSANVITGNVRLIVSASIQGNKWLGTWFITGEPSPHPPIQTNTFTASLLSNGGPSDIGAGSSYNDIFLNPGINGYVQYMTYGSVITSCSTNPPQLISSFDSIPNQTYSYNATVTVTPPSASSSLPVTVTVKSGPATISGNTVTLTGAGTVVLAANQSGSTNFAPASEVTTSFSVGQGSQSISFGALPNRTYGSAPFTLNATASSGLPVSYSSSSTNVSLSSNVVTILGAGTASITASQPGNSNWSAATPVSQNLIIAQASNTITAFMAIPSQTYSNGANVTITPPPASSTLPVTLTVKSGPATINSNTVTLTGAGTVILAANQGGNANYLSASEVTTSFSVGIGSQTISFGALPNRVYGGVPFTLNATASSGLPVSYSWSSTNVSLSSNVVTILGAGTATITASQNGNGNWSAATPVSQNVVISKKAAAVSITGTNVVYNGSGQRVTVTTMPTGLCNQVTYNGATNLPTNAGIYPVIASVTDANYTGSGTATFTITKASNVITFAPLAGITYINGLKTNLGASASSGLGVSCSSSSTNISLSSNVVTILGAGTATITASQPGNSNWSAATPVTNTMVISKKAAIVAITGTNAVYNGTSQRVVVTTTPARLSNQVTYSGVTNLPVNAGIYPVVVSVTDANYTGSGTATFTIAKASNVITFGALGSVVIGASPFALSATASSGLVVGYSSSSTNIVLKGNVVTVLGAGTATITASQPGDTNWNAATNVIRTLVVTGATASTNTATNRIVGIGTTNVVPTIPVRPNSFPLVRSTNSGSVVAWGDNTYGETNIPAGLTNVIQLSTRGIHSLALKTNGSVTAWGWNSYGQTNVPATATNVVQIAAGLSFSAALRANRTVVTWGNGSLGQTNIPVGLTNVVQIAAGSDHVVALKSDGTVVAWGWDAYGQTNVPATATNVVQVAGGYFHSVALRANGTVVAWGDNTYGETNVPAGLTNVVRIATGLNHTVALKGDGTVVVWGWNNAGQTNVPAGLSGVAQIASGGNTVFAVTTNGTLVTWGDNSYGQRKPPAGLTNVMQFVLGLYHGLGLKK